MLKKAGFVTAAVAGMMMIGGTAFAAPAETPSVPASGGDYISFADAYNQFIEGGGALGYGAASVIAGAYAGIVTTPAELAHSLSHHGH